ncbi:MAG: type II secretion system F family protein [Clostridia bacterium]|nr:type II secretion system F family protein [Clostridia bacterium]
MKDIRLFIQNNPNTIHSLTLLLIAVALSIALGLLTILIYKLYKSKRDRFKAVISQNNFVLEQRDNLSKWVKNTEKRIKKNNLKIKVKRYLLISVSSFFIAFFMGIKLFENLTASILFAIVFFIVPEYLISLYEDNSKKKTEEQLVLAIKYYTGGSFKGRPMQKIIATIANKTGDPVGRYFSDCYCEIIKGIRVDTALSKLASRFSTAYGKMFVQLIHQSKTNRNCVELMTDLLAKLEGHIELTRTNKTNIATERLQAFLMSMLPIPTYIFMSKLYPETEIFIRNTYYGRLIITLSFLSVLVFIMLDRFIRKV